MVFNFAAVGLLVGLLWLLVLTLLFWKLLRRYSALTKGVNAKKLDLILEDLLKEVKVSQKDIEIVQKRCDTIQKDALFHVQKVGLVRFNPFKDTGGDQSFILALVDANDSGVVISSLYSRVGTRWYAKRVKNGKATDHQLSEEEAKALKLASD